MIYKGTCLHVFDNSGVFTAKCVHIYSNRKFGQIGDTLLVVLTKIKKKNYQFKKTQLKKGQLKKAVIIGTKKNNPFNLNLNLVFLPPFKIKKIPLFSY